MKHGFLQLIAASIFCALSGCASLPADAPAFQPLPKPTQGFSNLYVYRIGAFPSRRAPDITVNDRPFFSPLEGSYTALTVPAGAYVLKLQWPRDTGAPSAELRTDISAGESAYIKVTSSITKGKSSNGWAAVGGSSITTEMLMMDSNSAEIELRACCRFLAK